MMGDLKWIKLTISIFEDEKIRLIDAMPERDTIHYVWIRLLVQAGKTNSNGFIFLSENIPYTDEMLSTIFCRPLLSIRLALKILKDFGMIEIDESNLIKITNWEKHQNIEGMEKVKEQNRKRVEKYREKKRQLKVAAEEYGENTNQIQSDEQITSDNSVKGSNVFKNDENNLSEKLGENNCNATQNLCNVMQNSCDVTEDLCNVTVTEQNKKETKNKKEIKNENKKERENIDFYHEKSDLNLEESEIVKSSVSQSKDSNTEYNKNLEDINTKCIELVKYSEAMTGIPNVLNLGALKLAISMHGKQYVKMAIDIALKANKPNMIYIDGILKNWRREGYPRDDMEVNKNGIRSFGKNNSADKKKFAGFKPKEPRKLTEAERKRAEANLI
ncbi:phage replisome organizer N-terminal domain-containing protein [Clostridium saccharobutylicum]|uniref:Phage replisome organizer, putative n=2 Tax=Clostridium saccharobutylicum TaxID=169679 RepID=U5MPW6_CLOSA|nr:phage replisome organizer, putative [Clostridium saccharobutylicum DSM 13864]MBA2905634.1 putative phage replisome organizer [Clostridium saccharobutylicum]MBA8790202.1 putative phage replisome organizer [Clostridium saccharobutylicum]MBA8896839.1 putative phage replisome organizer [Clostridium saccharobutylicum]MBA8982437.1 putative phage replisome organizer [Clostridium saccharobutylicum]